MILAATALQIILPIVVTFQVIVALLLVLIVLMQKPKEQGLGAAFGGGAASDMFGARATDVLQKGTVYLGVLFFILTITLAILTAASNKVDLFKNEKALPDTVSPVAAPVSSPTDSGTPDNNNLPVAPAAPAAPAEN